MRKPVTIALFITLAFSASLPTTTTFYEGRKLSGDGFYNFIMFGNLSGNGDKTWKTNFQNWETWKRDRAKNQDYCHLQDFFWQNIFIVRVVNVKFVMFFWQSVVIYRSCCCVIFMVSIHFDRIYFLQRLNVSFGRFLYILTESSYCKGCRCVICKICIHFDRIC